MGEIVWALNEKNDSLSDLLSYTRSYGAEYLSQNGIYCTTNFPDQIPTRFISGEFRRNIFLTVKEVLHNIVKHAQAKNVNIFIQLTQELMIQIQDDGIGFNRNEIRPFSNGLNNMEKRMTDIGGTLEIKNTGGTTITMNIPLPV
jgi:signal transduction histidine kinase